MPLITAEQLQRAAPRGQPDIIAAIAAQADTVLPKYGLDTLNRVRIFLSIPIEETGLWNLREDLQNYTAQRISQVWPGRYPTPLAAAGLAHNARALAAAVYGHRGGNVTDDDALNYRGGGLIQTTFKDAYAALERATGLLLLAHPDMIADPAHALECAAAQFVRYHDVLALCDAGNSRAAWALVGSGRKGGPVINLANHEDAYAHVCAAIPALGRIDVAPTPVVNQINTRASAAPPPLLAVGDTPGLIQALAQLGYPCAPGVPSGAVAGFQIDHGSLIIDGDAGPLTVAAINAALADQLAKP
jgi:predicted chitinase